MIDDQQRARELMADWHRRKGCSQQIIDDCLSGAITIPDFYMDLLAASLRAAPDGLIEQHARDSQELRRLCQSRDFYKLRCEALQAVQSSMRDPERKAVCDILANGSTSALAVRPQGVK